ncbi:MAG TPA: CbiQ family ECF transporter T component, partial [Methanomicrobiales archaeon]|nr:CbiQ family ECF transporter T component [Methanomicrobiales archaeon]
TSGAADLTLLVIARALGGTTSLFFIALTTPIVEVFSLLRSWGFPAEFTDLAMLVYRSIFVLIGEAIAIANAQTMRHGYTTVKASLSSLSMLGSMLFIRAWDRGEELLTAMDSRCYDGILEFPEERRKVSRKGIISVIAYLSCSTLVLVLSAPLQVF